LLEHQRMQRLSPRPQVLAQRGGVPIAAWRRPMPPRRAAEPLADELEEAIRQQPAALIAHELGERALLRRSCQRRERCVPRRPFFARIDAVR
jgi:hypothetical protein